MLQIAFADPVLPRSGTLAILVAEGAEPNGLWREADEATGGALARAFAAAEFTGKVGKSCTVLAPGAGLARVVAVGLGREAPTRRVVEDAAATLFAALPREGEAALAVDGLPPELAAAAALGAVLRSYRFDRYRTREKPEDKAALAGLTVLTADPALAEQDWSRERAVAEGVFLARDLVSEPPNVLNPAEFARRCEGLRHLGVEVEVLGPEQLAEAGFGALLGVSQGSANEPRLVAMRWRGTAEPGGSPEAVEAPPIAFVGKGVTFDSGGISIKPAAGMEDMKWDMAGAGAVTGLMAALAGRKARVDAVGVVGLVENMPSGTAQRPGDVVTSLSGQTVEIINTDAEGRLVLADAIWWTQERYKPRFVVDLATLTGAMVISLGHEFAGLFANDEVLADRLLAAGRDSGEKLWRMPLAESFDKAIKSDIADMKHTGPRPGGAISAAHFIQRFTNGVPWAHLDIAGTAWSTRTDQPCVPKGATAFGVRLLDRLVAEHYED